MDGPEYFIGSKTGYNSGVHEWTIKIIKTAENAAIGIVSTKKCFEDSFSDDALNNGIYCIQSNEGKLELSSRAYRKINTNIQREDCGWRQGDIVTIKLDCNEWKVGFKVSDDVNVNAFPISKNLKYYMFVRIASNYTEYQLLSQW